MFKLRGFKDSVCFTHSEPDIVLTRTVSACYAKAMDSSVGAPSKTVSPGIVLEFKDTVSPPLSAHKVISTLTVSPFSENSSLAYPAETNPIMVNMADLTLPETVTLPRASPG